MRRALGPAFVTALLGCATVAPTREGPAEAPGRQAARAADGFSEADLPEADDAPPEAEAARPTVARFDDDLATFDFQARLAVRARSYLGRRGPFRSKGQRFGSDCSGFVEAVYSAEGLMLREFMQRVAPDERGGVKAAWYAARAHGRVFGPPEWPAPGDLVFWSDTYDRNRNGKADDRFTHLGIVEYVEDGTVHFLHRGGKGVARGVMTPGRPDEASDADGRKLNSHIRATTHPLQDGGFAGALLEGYGRIDPTRVPAEYATGRIDPFFGPGADREPRDVAATAATPAARPVATASADAPAKKRTAAAKPARKKKVAKKAYARAIAPAAKPPARTAAAADPPPAR